MVRSVADRAFLPTKNLLEEVGDMMILTGKTIVSAIRPPYPYGGEFVSQFLFALRLCWFPLLVSTVAFGYGAPGLQAANFLVLFGALDRLGGFFVLSSIREFAPFVDAIVMAGVAGTAITADLGARKIREELDALQVLGVDPIKNLVVPRFLSLMIVTGLFDIYALIFGVFGGVLATLVNHAPLGPFFSTFFNNASTTDLWGSIVKTTLFGAIIAIVCCYKGMTASGGAEGVGRAVNQAVVIAFLGIFGFKMAAKIGTGLVAEIGSMKISDEIDALEVMGISGIRFLCATRLLAAWMVLPFVYLASIGAGFFASYLAVVQQIGGVSSGGFFLIFWQFQNPPDLLYSLIKAMSMPVVIVIVGCYYAYNASGGPVGVGTATAKSMVLNLVSVHLIGMLGTQLFWGANPRAPIGG